MPDFPARYIADLTSRPKFRRRLKVVAACGNGTAGAFAPKLLSALGVEVVPLDCELDFTFPRYNPNPEDMRMLHAMAAAVKESGADLALGFDGDGDRCGIVDNEGQEIFADKIGVMLARDLSTLHKGATFVVDVKSTGLFATDPALRANGVKVDFWKTGHSHIKRRVRDLNALAGFEKSGHFFFNAPVGRGYDDGFVTAIAILDMLDRNPGKSMADLYRELPKTWGSPTMSPHCADEVKYEVADRVVARLQAMQARGEPFTGQPIRDLVTVNGVRVTVEDGTWGLVRASSNKPELVVVVESPASEARMRAMFEAVDRDLAREPRSRRLQPDDLMRWRRQQFCPCAARPAQARSQNRLLWHRGRERVGGARRLLRPSAEPLLVGAPRLRADASKAQTGRLCRTAAMGLGPDRHRQARERHGSRAAARRAWSRGLRRARGEDHRRGAGVARVHEPHRRAPLSRPAAGFGEQPERIGRTRLWLLPSPSPTAGWNWDSNAHWWRMLADAARSAEPTVIPARAEATGARPRVRRDRQTKQVKPS